MVYTSSIFAFFSCLNMATYSVSKRGLEAFADCLRIEMASFGVKVRKPNRKAPISRFQTSEIEMNQFPPVCWVFLKGFPFRTSEK